MEDLVIPGIVRSVFIGIVVGTWVIGPVGWMLFGPIYGNSDVWFVIGGALGIALYLRIHFDLKKEQAEKNNRDK